MTAVPLSEAARALGISPSQLRREIAAGAPVARPGRRGPGGAALVVIADVERWRSRQSNVDTIMRDIGEVLVDVFRRDGGLGEPAHRSLAITDARAAALLLAVYERTARRFTGCDARQLPPALMQAVENAHAMRVLPHSPHDSEQ